MSNKIKVIYRIKPLNDYEEGLIISKNQNNFILQIDKKGLKNEITVKADHIFYDNNKQKLVFDKIIDFENIKENLLVFCYGETNSGKTYTMIGDKNWNYRGIIPRYIQRIYEINLINHEIIYSFIEIYNESIYDLFDNCKLINKNKENYKKIAVNSSKQIMELYINGCINRASSATKNNKNSSRSHSIFIIRINDMIKRKSRFIYFADLAGSEKFDKKEYNLKKEKETNHINKSISFFEELIINIENNSKYVNFRNSILNQVLKKCFLKSTLIISIINLNINKDNYLETSGSIRFGSRICKIDLDIIRESKNIFTKNTIKKELNNNNEIKLLKDQLNKLKIMYEESLMENKLLKDNCKNKLTNFNNENIKNNLKKFYNDQIDQININNIEEANIYIKLGKTICKEKIEIINNKFNSLLGKVKEYDDFHKEIKNEQISKCNSYNV